MSLIGVVVALLVLAAITQIGVLLIERVACAGRADDRRDRRAVACRRDSACRMQSSLPVVLIHGASSNLESMRQPLGDLLGRKSSRDHDRSAGSWLEHARGLESSTPAIQARMIDEALGKLGIDRARSSSATHGAARWCRRWRVNHPARVAGLVMLAPVTHRWHGGVAWYHNLGAMPVIGPLFAYTLALPTGALMLNPGARGAFLPQAMPDELCARHRAAAAAAAARVSRQCMGHGDAEGGGDRADAALRRDQGAGGDPARRRRQVGLSRPRTRSRS